jgi:hypothetical protein
METYFCRLVAPRSTFGQDMTAEERGIMGAHAEHWRRELDAGRVVTFGVVGDPAGVFGVGIVEFENRAALDAFLESDPTTRSGVGFRWEVLPMPFGAVHR